MISERQLCMYFDSFWQHHFPLLNPAFVRRFNAEQKERLFQADGSPLLPIPMGKDVESFDVAAEIAFETAWEIYKNRMGEVPDIAQATHRALTRIGLIRGGPMLHSPSPAEVTEAASLARGYEALFDAVADQGAIQFRPRIKGVGILDETEADFCTQSTLFEIKAVNRNLHSGDLRQVLCYIVAGLGSHEYNWTYYCIFNPRLAVTYTGKIDRLLSYLSGRTSHECITDIFEALMQREQPLETKH